MVGIVKQVQRRESDLAIRNIPRNIKLGLGFRGVWTVRVRVLREGIDVGDEIDVERADDIGGGIGEVVGLQGGNAGLRQNGDDLDTGRSGREKDDIFFFPPSLSLHPIFF